MTFINSIFRTKEKKRKIAPVNFLECPWFLEPENFGAILTTLKILTTLLRLVARILNFVVKIFLVYLLSMRESCDKNTSFLRHHVLTKSENEDKKPPEFPD